MSNTKHAECHGGVLRTVRELSGNFILFGVVTLSFFGVSAIPENTWEIPKQFTMALQEISRR